MNISPRPNRSGFTLVELLVVIVIIAMLMGLLTPAIVAARARARVAQCTNNQKNLGAAVVDYELSKQQFPGYVNPNPGPAASGTARPGCSWLVMILQQVDRADLWDEWRNPGASGPQVSKVALFLCPSKAATESAPLSYVANCGQQDNGIGDAAAKKPPDWQGNGVFYNHYPFDSSGKRTGMIVVKVSMSDVKDGTAHTLLISENNQAGSWAVTPNPPDGTTNVQEPAWGMVWQKIDEKPVLGINQGYDDAATDYNHARPSSGHAGGVVATFCDGHTQFLNEKMDYTVYALLMTPDGSKAKSTETGNSMAQSEKLDDSMLE